MSSIEDELKQMTNYIRYDDINTQKLIQSPHPKSAIDELKETLLSLREINPALVDSSRIFEHLLTLVDAQQIVQETNIKIDSLQTEITQLKQDNSRVNQSLIDERKAFTELKSKIEADTAFMVHFKERSLTSLQAIEQYLRTH
jgi:predicted nuclease with TOPRIM domain